MLQITIFGVGAIPKRTVVITRILRSVPWCTWGLSCDHQVIDEATAEQFMVQVKGCLKRSHGEHIL